MTKAALVATIANETKLAKSQVEKVLNSFKNAIVGKVYKKGEKFSWVGFGTWSLATRKARKGRNPQTGAAMKIKASKVLKFKASKALK